MPMPYDAPLPAGTPTVGLATAEAFVVVATRLWAAPHRVPGERHPDWRDGFVAGRIAPWGAQAFDTFFWIVLAGGQRGLDIRCAACPEVGADEAWLVMMTGMIQDGRRHAAEGALLDWMPPAPCGAAFGHLASFAHAMAAAGLLLVPRRPVASEAPAGRPQAACLH
jgi:hypothetical protein